MHFIFIHELHPSNYHVPSFFFVHIHPRASSGRTLFLPPLPSSGFVLLRRCCCCFGSCLPIVRRGYRCRHHRSNVKKLSKKKELSNKNESLRLISKKAEEEEGEQEKEAPPARISLSLSLATGHRRQLSAGNQKTQGRKQVPSLGLPRRCTTQSELSSVCV